MRAALTLGLACGLSTWFAAAAQPITVAWRDKAPYHYLENSTERGFLLLRAKRIFALAEVPTEFVERPSKRIWRDFQRGKSHYCSIGWYRLPEREQVAQFSLPFHVDPPQLLLVNPDALPAIRAHDSFAALMADPGVVLGVVDGVSYGPVLDRQIVHSANRIERVTVSPASMIAMLAAKRIDYMLADQADWHYLRRHDETLGRIAEYQFGDMPPGLERFIVCSKDVPPQVMSRINHAIAELAAPTEE